MQDPIELRKLLRSHYGSETLYRHPPMRRFTYTEGVRAFAESAGGGAHWHLDIIATESDIARALRSEGFLVVDLDVSPEGGATITVASDKRGDGAYEGVAFFRDISWTDCPPGLWDFYLATNELDEGEVATLLLTSEY